MLLMINVNIIVAASAFPAFWEAQFSAIQVQV